MLIFWIKGTNNLSHVNVESFKKKMGSIWSFALLIVISSMLLSLQIIIIQT
jgi:hypothetical protein